MGAAKIRKQIKNFCLCRRFAIILPLFFPLHELTRLTELTRQYVGKCRSMSVKIRPHLIRFSPNQSEPVRTCPNQSELVRTCPNLSELTQAYQAYPSLPKLFGISEQLTKAHFATGANLHESAKKEPPNGGSLSCHDILL